MDLPGGYGKKVIFLYPPPVLGEVVDSLARLEFEVYLLRDHQRVVKFLEREPSSIVFINLDDGLEEPRWAAWIGALRNNLATAGVGVGIVTLNDHPELREKDLMELRIPCGFVTLKIGVARALDTLVKILDANEARGRRRFVRATCPAGSTSLNYHDQGQTVRGEVSDLSTAGMAVRISGGVTYPAGSVLRDLQVTIKGVRLIADVVVIAQRSTAGDGSHVVLFDPKSIDDGKRERIHGLVHKLNQSNMDSLLKSL